ncbi:histidine kinase [Halobacteriales archaeon QS_1_68_17]|nr:MAG: histidine kinase [Halobacteriales archaeon QS_1_68_17]
MGLYAEFLVSGVAIAGGLIGYAVAYVAWLHRDHPAAKPFAKMTFFAGTWGLLFGALVFVSDPGRARAVFAAIGVASVFAPAYFTEFVVVYTGHEEWLTPRRHRLLLAWFGGLGVVGLLDLVAGIFYESVTFVTANGLTLPVAQRTALSFAIIALVYLPLLFAFGLLIRFLVSGRNVYRKQTAVILAAALVGLAGNVLFQAGVSPHPGLDTTPIFYAVEAVVILLALFYYELLDIEPLAPDVVLREIQDPVVVLDDDGSVIEYNPAAESLFSAETNPVGYHAEYVLPGLLDAAREGEEYATAWTDAGTATDGGAAQVFDVSAAPIRDQYDRQRGEVIVLRDITVQKQRERTLEKLQSASQRFLGADSRDAVAEIAVETADEVLGYPYSGIMLYDETEDVLRPASFADPLADAFAETSERPSNPVIEPDQSDIWTVFESGEPRLGEPIEVSDDRELPVDIGGSILLPLGDHGVLGISDDESHEGFTGDDRRFANILATATENALDRVDKEERLREKQELLEQRKEQLEFFNSVLRHDLLNGMMVIQGNVELLADHVDEEGAAYLSTVEDWSNDITTLAEKVRSVTRTITDERNVELGPVDLGAPIRRKADKLASAHDAVTVRIDVPENTTVLGDDLVPEVVENVLWNAVEHNDSDEPEVIVTTRRTGDRVQVRIADNGPGIPDEIKETVFEERVTGDDSGSVGFGLYFVCVMMDLYGGDAWFEDRQPWTVRADGAADADTRPEGAVAVLEFRTPDAA